MRFSATRSGALVLASASLWSFAAAAQGAADTLPDIVVTADRQAEPIGRTGSAISVVRAEEILRTNPTTLVDALREVPGLDITETGGPGAATAVRLRGANAGQTLVLIDGVRVNDPSSANSEFDFSVLAPGAIERVEVLRGPQSALYGSDAIGGVVNIITKKGTGAPVANVRAEAGRYGTVSTIGSVLGSSGPWSYAFTGSGQASEGFSRYGYRIPEIEKRFPRLDNDGFARIAGSGRLGYDDGKGVRLDLGVLSSTTNFKYDAASGAFPDTPSRGEKTLHQAWARGAFDTLDGAWTHNLSVFANRNDRVFNDVSYRTNTLPQNTTSTISTFTGDRVGSEYQGNIRLGTWGSLIVGGRLEEETALTTSEGVLPRRTPPRQTLAGVQDTRSVFSLWNLPIGERLTVTLGGRVDDVKNVDRFATWRATAAYLIPESGTKLRASAGTGGKAPTLFQLYAPTFGNPNLESERSFGADAGIDQSFWDNRVSVSVTAFANRFDNLIDFDLVAQRYFNVAQAESSGVEVGAGVELWPQWARLKAAYTHLYAVDLRTGLTLARRPADTVRASVAITPTPEWLIEPRLTYVSRRFSSANETNPVGAYARYDIYAERRIDANWKVFARLDNVTDVRYQEVFNYGTTGRALYGGFNATW